MYGDNMGEVILYSSRDAEPLFGTAESTYSQIWDKAGNQGDAWHTATITIDSDYPQWLKLIYTGGSGVEYTSDFALDDFSVVAGGVPTSMPTSKSTIFVETFTSLKDEMTDLNEVWVTDDVPFSETIMLDNVKGLIIRSEVGATFKGENERKLFHITGESGG